MYKEGRTFSVKDQTENTLGFASPTMAVATTELCFCSTKTAIDNNVNE
jgi:hypothetical protein